MSYGIPYQGSKNTIADQIMAVLPSGKRFVDLFGGGAAMSHAAAVSCRYQSIYYNEIDPQLCEFLGQIIRGDYAFGHFVPEWISHEDFAELKDKDAYIRYLWSFGNGGTHYLYGYGFIEDSRRALHKALFPKKAQDVTDGLLEYGALVNQLVAKIRKDDSEKDQWQKEYERKKTDPNLARVKEQNWLSYEKAMARADIMRPLSEYFMTALEKSGLSVSDVNKALGTKMGGHYFCRTSQWCLPTREAYEKLQALLGENLGDSFGDVGERYGKLKDQYSLLSAEYDNLKAQYDFILRGKTAEEKMLENLGSIEHLKYLVRIQELQGMDSIEIHCGSYKDYEYRPGDVVYCDPPYEGTKGYQGEGAAEFDSREFYDWVASRPYQVFFSSYGISDDRFFRYWSAEKVSQFSSWSRDVKVETIYTNRRPEVSYTIPEQLDLF